MIAADYVGLGAKGELVEALLTQFDKKLTDLQLRLAGSEAEEFFRIPSVWRFARRYQLLAVKVVKVEARSHSFGSGTGNRKSDRVGRLRSSSRAVTGG